MKFLNLKIILITFLILSLWGNVYFLYSNKLRKKIVTNDEYNPCVVTYWDYYLNTPKDNILDFDEVYTKECLKETFAKTFYDYDGINNKILEDLKRYKEKKWDILDFYKNILKEKFKLKSNSDTIDYKAIKLALDLIWDEKFSNSKLIKDILSGKNDINFN